MNKNSFFIPMPSSSHIYKSNSSNEAILTLVSHSTVLSPYHLCRARYIRNTRKLKKCAILDSQGRYLSGSVRQLLAGGVCTPRGNHQLSRNYTAHGIRVSCYDNPLWNKKQNDEFTTYEDDLSPVMFDNPNYQFPNVDQLLVASEGFNRLREDDSSASEDGSMKVLCSGANLHAATDSLCSSVTSTSSFLPLLQQPLLAVEEDANDDYEDDIELCEAALHGGIPSSSSVEISQTIPLNRDILNHSQMAENLCLLQRQSTLIDSSINSESEHCRDTSMPTAKDATPLTERVIYSPCSVDSGIQSQPTSNYDLASNVSSDAWKKHQTAYKVSSEVNELAHCWEQPEMSEAPTSCDDSAMSYKKNIVTPVWAQKLAATPSVKITMDKRNGLKSRKACYDNGMSPNAPVVHSSHHHHHRSSQESIEDVGGSYAVHYLGQAYLYESDVTPERSSRSVNRCIQQVTSPRRDFNETLPKWTEGHDLTLQLNEKHLLVYHTITKSIHLRHSILSIRVWGIGHSNLHDFAYVARDPSNSKRYVCHVLRCNDVYANEIANQLCSLCRRLASDNSSLGSNKHSAIASTVKTVSSSQITLQSNTKDMEMSTTTSSSTQLYQQSLVDTSWSARTSTKETSNHVAQKRPQDLPGLVSRQSAQQSPANIPPVVNKESLWRPVIPFTTPIDEPKHAHECRYLGTQKVVHPSGVQMLNAAIDRADAQLLSHDRELVRVLIAPSTIVIQRIEAFEAVPIECRIRFLSFMAVSKRDPRLCGFVIHTVSNEFLCHVFECSPDATQLTKLIESACQLRYHMCMDARVYASTSNCLGERKIQPSSSSNTVTPSQNLSSIAEFGNCASFSKYHVTSSFSASTLSSLTPSTPKERVKESFSNVFAYLGWSTR